MVQTIQIRLIRHQNNGKKNTLTQLKLLILFGAYIENSDDYDLTMWVSIDSGVFIKITKDNADELIRYLYERFPY